MSPPSDHLNEMPPDTLTDDAIEAFFLGLPDAGWENEASLGALADDMALAMNVPAPVPDHALLRFFWGAPAQQPEPARTSVPAWDVPAARQSVRVGGFRGRLRVVAGAALGTALALFGVGVAGATGMLPDPAQRVVARAVEIVSPFELPHPQSHPGESSGGGAATITDGSGGQLPTTDHQSTVSGPGTAPTGPQAPPPAPTPNAAPPTGPGATGLDTAGQTPAGQWIPPSVPGVGPPGIQPPTNSGSAPATGFDTAGQTPAATAVPSSVPGPPGGSPPQRGR